MSLYKFLGNGIMFFFKGDNVHFEINFSRFICCCKWLRKIYDDSDYYDSPYDIDFEDDPFRRTEKIYALHEEGQEELDDYYDEEYELNSGLYDDDDNYNEYNEYDNYDNDDNYDEYEEGQEDNLW